MKVYVYTIAKNEEKFAETFMRSASEADGVFVLDTGSADGTVEKLRELGAKVDVKVYDKFRFDDARNDNLDMVPDDADICVCFDMDELLTAGWRDKLEAAWKDGTEQADYRYVWNYNEDGGEGVTFNREKIHKRHGFKWVYPVHEVLRRTDGAKHSSTVFVDGITCEHHADEQKSRAQYLELLELSVKERPDDDRNLHYLGREYMFRGRYNDAIRALNEHLRCPAALWAEERAASMRFIGRCYDALNYPYDALWWFQKAAAEAPLVREGWYEAAKRAFGLGDFVAFDYFARETLKIKDRKNESYIQESEPWSGEIERLVKEAALIRAAGLSS